LPRHALQRWAHRCSSVVHARRAAASLPALSLIALCSTSAGPDALVGRVWLADGCAVLMKQSGFDAGLAAVAFQRTRRRRAGIVPCGGGGLCAGAGCGGDHSPSFHDWWYAMVTYRGQGDSIVSGSLSDRFSQFRDTLPEVLRALAPLAALTIYGWRRSPVLLRLWLGAAALGVVGGGNFHAHYYIQLAAPLSVLAGVGAARLWETRSGCGRLPWPHLLGRPWRRAALVRLAPAQAATFPNDEHLQHDAPRIAYVRSHRPPASAFVMGGRERLHRATAPPCATCGSARCR
jgi:hypothetical protein